MFYLSLSGVLGVVEDIYLTGGRDGEDRPSKEVSVYNTRSREWRPLCQMNKARYSHDMVMLKEKIYVIGGEGEGEGKESKEGEDSEKETFIEKERILLGKVHSLDEKRILKQIYF